MLQHMPSGVDRRRFTADEYEAMGRAGILRNTDRVELIEGEILEMAPIGPLHAAAVDRAADALTARVRPHAIVRVQSPIRLAEFSEPQPDVVLLRRRDDFYRAAHPQPPDILLVIEIAVSSLYYDRDVKASLYAAHGIVEYWLVDVEQGLLICYRSPEGGIYRSVVVRAHGESIAPQTLPGCEVSVDDLL
jgi:Uma2 family endonuclease